MKRIVLSAIAAYRRYLSPLKGFSCAYRVLAGGDSCSAYGYRVIERYGVLMGWRLLRRRLDACARHHRQHQQQQQQQQQHARQSKAGIGLRARHQAGFCDLPCDVPSGFCDLPCDVPSGSSCDWSGGAHHDNACDLACNMCDAAGHVADCYDMVSRTGRRVGLWHCGSCDFGRWGRRRHNDGDEQFITIRPGPMPSRSDQR